MSFHTSIPFLALLLAGIVPGCSKSSGPDLGEVTGTVTLDGRPLEGASLNFVPQGTGSMTSGRASVGVTDAQGKYTLGYSGTKSGAMIGKHRVKISTQRTAGEDEEGNPLPAVKEKVPVQYNVKAAENPAMEREVKAGTNEINFELKGDGEVIQRPVEDNG